MKKVMMPIMGLLVIISLVFAVQGVMMHAEVGPAEDALHAVQADYFSQAKSIRDGAATGSELNDQLVEIQQGPSTLLALKLIGVGKILTGIFVLLFGILLALIVMPVRLGKIIKGQM